MSTGKGEFELNLAPIIDCFTVLITYLLLSASFISLGILSITVAANEESGTVSKPPAAIFTLELTQGHDFVLISQRAGESAVSLRIPGLNRNWDYSTLESQLQNLKDQVPSIDSLLVSADDSLVYEDLVKAINHAKKTFVNVAVKTE